MCYGHTNRPSRQRLQLQFIARPEISDKGERHIHILAHIPTQVWNRLFEKCAKFPPDLEGYRVRTKIRDLIVRIGKRQSNLHLDKKDPTLDDAKRYGFYTKKKWKDNDFEI